MSADDERLLEVLQRGQRRGFLGTGDLQAHLRHARAHCNAANPTPGQRWCDLGSGGGVPGLVIALDLPEVKFVLLDRSQRRTEFLADSAHRLGIGGRIRVACGDAADLAHRPEHRHVYDGVVSRAFGTPATVAECASGLVRPGGRLVVSEPPSSDAPLQASSSRDSERSRWPADPLAELGWDFDGHAGEGPTFAILTRRPSHQGIYPRTWKQIRKRPLF
ncbi:16S rRNA (guanine(527)-N(7))-methyltransferase RsmG [Candidatus Poriferisodalis sp.]|uniref:16S rRNA (guanine(527)-N(7))-methyltransferase RsmG n=1 Tax=Candidatus Poriferisodalis sp. TaxID=3101277 RepID=UPI003B01A99D